MASQSVQLIKKIAAKLGVNNSDVIKNGYVNLRLFQSKSSVPCSEILKTVICLDIASAQIGVNFDKAAAQKLSVATKPQYQKTYLHIKKVLLIENQKTVHEICVQLSCEEANKQSEELLNTYKEHDTLDRDFSHPQYAVAAVYTICKLNKIAVKKSDFVTMSTLKSHQWNKLEAEFLKFANSNFKMELGKKTGSKKQSGLMDIIEEKSKFMLAEKEEASKKSHEESTKVESYEIWRQRILEEAYAHVNSAM